MPQSNSNNQVTIKITEQAGPPQSIKIDLDNEPFNLSGLGTGNKPQTGAPIQWVIDPQSSPGWDFTNQCGVTIKSPGTNFELESQVAKTCIWKRKYADCGYYAYSISLTKTVNNTATMMLIIDPTIINQP